MSRVATGSASRGGLFLAAARPPAVGASVELGLELPNGAQVALRGTVQAVLSPEQAAAEGRSPGVGVKFDARHDAEIKRLAELAAASGAGADGAQVRSKTPQARPGGPVAPIVGIDFGTTFSSVSVAIGDRVYMIPDEQGRVLHPSIVHYPRTGDAVVGWRARELLLTNPRRTVASSKRLLGRGHSDPQIAGYLQQSIPYKTVAGPNDQILVDFDGDHVALVQICAAVIAHVRDLAERRLATTVGRAVLSVPVSFGDPERAALRRAAQLAGLEVAALVPEPVAGAFAYGLGQQKNEIVAVYDFGGGTFDFTVIDLTGDRFRLLATAGDAWLGGDDFDLVLAQAIADAFWRATKVELRKRAVEWQRLLFACEQAKRDLTTAESTHVTVEKLLEQPKRVDLRQKLDRPLFERLCNSLFERSLAVCRDVFDRAGLEPDHVTEVVLTGGVSQTPFIRKGLERYFERPIASLVNPDEAVCLGAGLHAARLASHFATSAGKWP